MTKTTAADFMNFGQPKPLSEQGQVPATSPSGPSTPTTAADFMSAPTTPGLLERMNANPVGRTTLGLLTTAGKALQPFMAPQQVLFGAIGWTEHAVKGEWNEAGETLKRGVGAAGDYLTYGYTARPNMLGWGDAKDAREKAVTGYEVAKNAGMPDWAAKPVGLAADFLVDVPLLGWLGKVGKLDKALDVTLGVERLAGANMTHAFTRAADGSFDTAGLRKFAIRVAATPFSTAPIHDLATGLPSYYRDAVAKTTAGLIEEGLKVPMMGKEYTLLGGRSIRTAGGRESAKYEGLGPTIAQSIISKFGGVRGLPRMEGTAIADLKAGKVTGTGISSQLEKYIYQTQSEAGSVTLRASQAQARYADLTGTLSRQGKEEFDRIAYSILDWGNVGDFHRGMADLDRFSRQVGDPAFKENALKTLWESSALDTYMGLLRFKAGTMGAEAVSGNYQGLRRLERATFGQPKTENPLAARFAQDVRDARTQGVQPLLPETALHFRRAYNLQFQPHDIIDQVRSQALPGMMHQIDEGRLSSVFADMLGQRLVRSGASTQTIASARPVHQMYGQTLAADFTQMFKGKNVDERTAMMGVLTKYGYGQQEMKDILDWAGKEWWQQTGIAYRPPSEQVVAKLMEMSDNPGMVTGAGAAGTPLGTNRSVLGARQDLPEWMRESMGQIHDIGELLDQTRRIGTKQMVNRSTVQGVYDFLHAESAVMSKEELARLPGGGHSNWRRVTPDLAARLKAMGDSHGGTWGDIPFKGDEYIPAAYHDLLVMSSTIDDPQILNATFSYLMQAWKAHKVGNVASIVRDTLTNYRFASDFGIRPDQLTRAVHAGLTLRAKATEGGGLGSLRGKRPDVLDDKAYVVYRGTKITMQELTEVGGLFHGSFFVNELDEPYRALRDNLASSRGSGMQGVTAAILDFNAAMRGKLDDAAKAGSVGAKAARGAGVAVAGAVDLATGLGGPVTKKLGDLKGQVDVIYKLGVYMHKRSEGLSSMDAAQYADELLFNYQNQPLMVDWLRRNGISPFAAFQFMSAGRFMRTMYENPYAVSRWYRLPQSMSNGDERTQGEMKYTAPEYMRKQLWIPLFDPFNQAAGGKAKRDSENRSMFLNLSSVMPESSIFNMTGTDAISQWIPPYLELMQQIQSGKGYQEMPLYDGGKSLAETLASGNKQAAYKGIVKALHQFGASPWAPGSPQADRLARALASAAVPADQVMHNPEVQAWMKFATQGAFAAPLQDTPIAPQRTGSAAPLDPGYAVGRAFGFTTTPVTGYSGKPGSAIGTVQGLGRNIDNLRAQMVNDIKNAGADPDAVKQAWAKYAPLIEMQRRKIEGARTFMEQYEQSYQSETPR